MAQLTMVQVERGNFSAKGNFSAYDAAGLRYHVSKAQMDALSLTPEKVKDIKYPMFAAVTSIERSFPVTTVEKDAAGNETTVTSEKKELREEATLFLTKDRLISAYNSSQSLQIEAVVAIKQEVTKAGLTMEDVKLLTATPV
jgi:hypothetical protein